MTFAASVLVASFGYLLASSTPVYAADATWEGDNVVYEGSQYEPLDLATTKGLDGLPSGVQVYQYTQTVTGPVRTAKLIYFDSGAVPKSAKEATYITYTLNPPNDYSNPSARKTITLTPAPSPESTSEGVTSCAVDNVGWLVCDFGGFIADAVDGIYRFLASFLVVEPIVGGDNSMYRLWEVMRNIANLAFIIGFMVVIYSYLVGGGFSNYDIKKIVPRLVIAAILINVSYWICAVAVDVSNIAGASLQDLFVAIRETAVGDEKNFEVSWKEMAAYIFSGGAIAGVAFLGIAGGSVGYLAFMLIGVLITVAFALFVALIIMAARQAIIIVLVVLAPIAFAAYVLPNTEKYFEKWRSIFFTMLLLFPIFSLLFGGSQLASAVIVQNADNMAVMLFGMAIQVIPLIITPLLIQFSGGLIGRIAGIVNSSQKGLFDRSKGWTQKQADYQKDRNLARGNNKYNRLNYARRGGQAMSRMGKNQEDRQKNYQTRAENMRHRTKAYDKIDTERRSGEAEHKYIEAHHDQAWKERFSISDPRDRTKRNPNFNQALFDQEIDTRIMTDKAKKAEEQLETAYTDMKAGYNPVNAALGTQGPANRRLQVQIDEAQITAEGIAWEGLRRQQAEVKIQQSNASKLKEDEVLRKYVGGIAGESGANRVYAKARTDVVQAYLEDVKASRSVLTEYSISELIELHQNHKPRGGGKATDAMIDAAMQEIVLSKGNNWSFQKTKDYIAARGMHYDEENNKYYNDYDFTTRKYSNEITDPDEIERRRDEQQLFVDAVKNSKLKIASLSGTDRGNMETGTFTIDSKNAIVRDIRDKKINANRLAGTDIDELMRMVQVLRDDDARGKRLSEDQRLSLVKTIEYATSDENPEISGNIGAREKEMMGVIAEYLQHGEELSDAEKWAIEEKTQTSVPTDYEPSTFYRVSAATSGKPDDEPYGPDGRTAKR